MTKQYLNISILSAAAILSIATYLTSEQSTVISNYEEYKVVSINEFRKVKSIYAAPSFKQAQEAGFNTDLILVEPTKFKDVKKPILKGYVKATDYLTKAQVVETSDLRDPSGIVYILKSESAKIKKRGYLWCTKQVSLISDDLDYSANSFLLGKDDKVYIEYVENLTDAGFTNINTFANELNMLGISKNKNGYSSGAIRLITAGRGVDMYTFSCEKENQQEIENELTEWGKLLIESNKHLTIPPDEN